MSHHAPRKIQYDAVISCPKGDKNCKWLLEAKAKYYYAKNSTLQAYFDTNRNTQ